MSDTITLGVAQRWCQEYERLLRASFASEDNPSGELPEDWKQTLDDSAELAPTTLRGALLRYGRLCRYYGEREVAVRERRGRRSVDPDEAQEAARAMLSRDPVYADLAGRRVKVTSRSYAAMAEVASHELRIRQLVSDLDDVVALYALAEARRDAAPGLRERLRLRRRMKRYQRLHARIYGEMLAHRRALYAHSLTPHGGRAQDPASGAPEWWEELGPEDDARLLIALFEVGPGRYARLGPPPAPPKKRSRTKDGPEPESESFGFVSLLAAWEKTLKLRPAELYDEDLARVMTAVRASAPAPAEFD